MSEHASYRAFFVPLPVITWLCFAAIVGLFWGYAFLLKDKKLDDEDVLRNELRELREANQRLLDAPPSLSVESCQCEATPTPQPVKAENGGSPEQQPTAQRSFVYTVRKGDNLWTIAARYRVEPDALLRWNNLTKFSRIFPGDQLTIILGEEGQEYREETTHSDDDQPVSVDRPAGSGEQILD